MMVKIRNFFFIKENILLAITLAFYALILEQFPVVFNDEPWLSELTLSFLKTGEVSQLSFPSLLEKTPYHAFPLMGWISSIPIKLLGYNTLSIRLIVFLLFIFSLPILYLWLLNYLKKNEASLFLLIYSLQLTVLNSSHIFRSEMISLFFLSVSLLSSEKRQGKKSFFSGLISNFGFWMHPLGVIAPFVSFVIKIFDFRNQKKEKLESLLFFVLGVITNFALFFMIADWESFHWTMFGGIAKTFAKSNLFDRLLTFPLFYFNSFMFSKYNYKIFIGLFSMLLISIMLIKTRGRDYLVPLLGFFSVLITLSVFGKANRFYFVYLAPWISLLYVISIRNIQNILLRKILKNSIILVLIGQVLLYYLPTKDANMKSYSNEVQKFIDKDKVVFSHIKYKVMLSSTNKIIAFNDFIWHRKFGGNLGIEDYLLKYKINYIIYSETMKAADKFLEFFPLNSYLSKYCSIVGTIKDNFYGSSFYHVLDFDYKRKTIPFHGVLKLFNSKKQNFVTDIYKCNSY